MITEFYREKYMNILGTDGNCEDATKFQTVNATLSIDGVTKTQGAGSLKVTCSAAGAFSVLTKNKYKIDNTKHYLAIVELKNVSAGAAFFQILKGSNSASIKNTANFLKGATSFAKAYVKMSPSELTGETTIIPKVYVNSSTAGEYLLIDAVRLYEITQETYDKISVDPDFTGEKLAARFPYSDHYFYAVNKDLTSGEKQEIWDYLPLYYRDSSVVSNLLDQYAAETLYLRDEVNAVLDQFFIDTATYGLARWESICGIQTDEAKPVDQRRSVIKSKLRGIGTVTAAMLKNVAESYDNGTINVTEDNANYVIKVTFVSTRGVPPNLADIQGALRELIPAHLGIAFEFTYLRWSELDSFAWTFSALDSKALTWSSLETYKP